jgi:hypothetical protein
MGIRKMYVKNRDVCKVTFSLPGDMANSAESACVVGDFNGWQVGATPMKKSRDGSFTATVNLSCGGEYQFATSLTARYGERRERRPVRLLAIRNTENSVVVIRSCMVLLPRGRAPCPAGNVSPRLLHQRLVERDNPGPLHKASLYFLACGSIPGDGVTFRSGQVISPPCLRPGDDGAVMKSEAFDARNTARP